MPELYSVLSLATPHADRAPHFRRVNSLLAEDMRRTYYRHYDIRATFIASATSLAMRAGPCAFLEHHIVEHCLILFYLLSLEPSGLAFTRRHFRAITTAPHYRQVTIFPRVTR